MNEIFGFLIRRARGRGDHQLLQMCNSTSLSGHMLRWMLSTKKQFSSEPSTLEHFFHTGLKGRPRCHYGWELTCTYCRKMGVSKPENSAFLALLMNPSTRHRAEIKLFMCLLPFKCLNFKACICKIAFFVTFDQCWVQSCPTSAAFWVSPSIRVWFC